MTYRKLRIAFSAVYGILCLLLIVMWMRSKYWVDQVFVPVAHSTYVGLGSMPNAFGVGLANKSPTGTWEMLNMPTSDWLAVGGSSVTWSGARTFIISNEGAILPYWFGVLLSATLATIPWFHWSKRFSLRTLLIAMTLIGLILGTIIATTR
jgi:hypothetical protein